MSAATWYELVGYAASALILVSLMMQSLLRLRIVNLVGATVFTVYGLLISAPPVWAVNAAIVVVDLWYLWRMLRSTEDLDVLRVTPDSAYLRRFLEFHESEIALFVPTFSGVRPDHGAFFVLRDLVPAALVLVRVVGNEAVVDLDYAIPAYRDYTSGEFVYGGDLFAEYAVQRVVTPPGHPAHDRYIRRMGFRWAGDQWELPVSR